MTNPEAPRGTNSGHEPVNNGLEFWSNVEKSSTSTAFIVATHLRNRGAAIDIVDEAPMSTRERMPIIAVYASPDAKRLLRESLDLPQVTTITRAIGGALEYPRPEKDQRNREWLNVAAHSWDEGTQRRIEALYWERTAAQWQDHIQYQKEELHKPWQIRHPLHVVFFFMERQEVKDTERIVKRCKILAREALGNLPRITPQDTKVLIESAVDQFLSTR